MRPSRSADTYRVYIWSSEQVVVVGAGNAGFRPSPQRLGSRGVNIRDRRESRPSTCAEIRRSMRICDRAGAYDPDANAQTAAF
jgi:hypothetical protein